MSTTHRFAESYEAARQHFRAATANLPSGAIDVHDGLTIDWAWRGDPNAAAVLVFSSGLHGVEGFAGSAAQLEMLATDSTTPTLFLHVLNPWGMSNIRRSNENNVDLNRNFLAPDQPYTSNDPTYATIDPWLNPPSPPGDAFFWARAAWIILRHGYQTLKNAVVGGQHVNPKGLFYGGDGLQPGPAKLLEFLDAQLGARERIVHVDLHSGLGAYGARTLLLEGRAPTETLTRARAAFGADVKGWDASNQDAYEIRGGLLGELDRRLAGPRYDGFTCEFGTQPNLKVLVALRNENRHHHWGGGALNHPTKFVLKEAFGPSDPTWRAGVLAHATEVQRGATAMLLS